MLHSSSIVTEYLDGDELLKRSLISIHTQIPDVYKGEKRTGSILWLKTYLICPKQNRAFASHVEASLPGPRKKDLSLRSDLKDK